MSNYAFLYVRFINNLWSIIFY